MLLETALGLAACADVRSIADDVIAALGNNSECWSNLGDSCTANCYATESMANNFIALRTMPWSAHGNTLYTEYQNGSQIDEDVDFSRVDFIEHFNVTADKWMIHNLFPNNRSGAGAVKNKKISDADKASSAVSALSAELHTWFHCAGDACP